MTRSISSSSAAESAEADGARVAESRRVARLALIFVGGEPEATVSSIEDLDPGAGPRPIVFVPLDPGGDRA